MNTATNTIPVVETTANGTTESVKAKQVKKSKIVTVGLNHGEVAAPEGLQTFSFDLGNFTKSVSELCKLVTWSITFRLMNIEIVLKPLTKTNDNGFRSFDVFKQIAAGMFAGYELEKVVKFDTASKESIVLASLYNAGFKFTTCCKKSVLYHITQKENVKKQLLKNIVENDNKVLRKEIALIDALKKDTANLRKLNGEAIGKFSLKFAAELSERGTMQIAEYSVKPE